MPITSKLVLVLGAGASAPYGFPTGKGLVRNIIQNLGEGSKPYLADLLEVINARSSKDGAQITEFVRALADANPPSIDAFLDSRTDFRAIGKVAIARALMPLESDDSFRSTSVERGWYHYLFERLFTTKCEDLSCNKLAVITFNFDRSFERAWFLFLKSRYGLSDPDAAKLATETIVVTHVHGQLSAPAWLDDVGRGRRYEPTTSPDAIRSAAAGIKIIQDEVDAAVLKAAQDAIAFAQTVCFLGFGYAPTNLDRLSVNTIARPMHGTAYGVPTGELEAIRRNFRMLEPSARAWDVLTFLEETHFIHGVSR